MDRRTGILETNGWDEYCRGYERHPDSDVVFRGYQLPEWEHLTRTVKEVARESTGHGLCQLGHGTYANGWVIVEANGQRQFIGAQIDLQRGIKREIMEQLEGVLNSK